LQQQLNASKAEVKEALDIQDEYIALQQYRQNLSELSSQFSSNAVIWSILLPLYSEAKFDNIRYDNGRFILRGKADKATELLAKLASTMGVLDAQFDLPVSTTRGLERFTISFRWQATEQAQVKQEQAQPQIISLAVGQVTGQGAKHTTDREYVDANVA